MFKPYSNYYYFFFNIFSSKLKEDAENMTSKHVENAAEELMYLSLDALQNSTDRVLSTPIPVWGKYLIKLFENITDTPIDPSKNEILTSKQDVYYLLNLITYISTLPEQELELYIWWTIVEEMLLHTTSDIRKLHNEYARSVTNLEGATPRSLYCTSGVNQMMGMAVSYAIAKPNFLTDIKPKVDTMLNNIREAFNNLVREITWMDDGTKCSTLEKSLAMKSLVGFPDWILKPGKLDEYYSGLKFNESSHLKNMVSVLTWQMTAKLWSVNETEGFGWATTPTNVNAYHTFQENAISKFQIFKLKFGTKHLNLMSTCLFSQRFQLLYYNIHFITWDLSKNSVK